MSVGFTHINKRLSPRARPLDLIRFRVVHFLQGFHCERDTVQSKVYSDGFFGMRHSSGRDIVEMSEDLSEMCTKYKTA